MSKTKNGVPWKELRQRRLSGNLENPGYAFSMKNINDNYNI